MNLLRRYLLVCFVFTQSLQQGCDCEPEVMYLQRHAERFVSTQDGVLTDEGFERANSLKDKVLEDNLEIDHILVSNANRDLLTVAPLMTFGIPVTMFPLTREDNDETARIISCMDPCPEFLQILYQNDWIGNLMTTLGFDISELDAHYSDNNVFHEFYTLSNIDKSVQIDEYGRTDTQGSVQQRADLVFPADEEIAGAFAETMQFCQPTTYYVITDSVSHHVTSLANPILTTGGFEKSESIADFFAETQSPLGHIVTLDQVSSFQIVAQLEFVVQVELVKYEADDSLANLMQLVRSLDPCPLQVAIVIEDGKESLLYRILDFTFPSEVVIDGMYVLDGEDEVTVIRFDPATTSPPTPSPPPSERTETTCFDDDGWWSPYGNCESYVEGEQNHNYCLEDSGLDGRIAMVACKISCGTCEEAGGEGSMGDISSQEEGTEVSSSGPDCEQMSLCWCDILCPGWGWSSGSTQCSEGASTSENERSQGDCS